jgi:tetratricopeptide (TPR) repeat protein
MNLICDAKLAAVFKRPEKLLQIGAQFCEMSGGSGLLQAGDYCIGLALNLLPGNRARANVVFQQLTESSSPWIRARAWLALGNNLCREGNHQAAHKCYHRAALAANDDLWVTCTAARNRAVIESVEGRHGRAMEMLNDLSSRIASLDYLSQCQYANSLAIDLSALGKYDEARKVLQVATSSPFVIVHPEITATANDIEKARERRRLSLTSISFSKVVKGARVLNFPTARDAAINRIEAVIYDESITARMLTAYADAGALTLARP